MHYRVPGLQTLHCMLHIYNYAITTDVYPQFTSFSHNILFWSKWALWLTWPSAETHKTEFVFAWFACHVLTLLSMLYDESTLWAGPYAGTLYTIDILYRSCLQDQRGFFFAAMVTNPFTQAVPTEFENPHLLLCAVKMHLTRLLDTSALMQ